MGEKPQAGPHEQSKAPWLSRANFSCCLATVWNHCKLKVWPKQKKGWMRPVWSSSKCSCHFSDIIIHLVRKHLVCSRVAAPSSWVIFINPYSSTLYQSDPSKFTVTLSASASLPSNFSCFTFPTLAFFFYPLSTYIFCLKRDSFIFFTLRFHLAKPSKSLTFCCRRLSPWYPAAGNPIHLTLRIKSSNHGPHNRQGRTLRERLTNSGIG